MSRVAIAAILQESNTFAVMPSSLEDFARHGIDHGDEVLLLRSRNGEVAGAIEVLESAGVELVPIVHTHALPSGRLQRDAFERLRNLLIDGLAGAGRLDGVLLVLHGALAAEHCDDADGALIVAARDVVGDAVPIVVTLDLHANVTRRMVDVADAVIGYKTNPHVDQAQTGAHGAGLLLAAMAGSASPVTRIAKRPLIVPAESMVYADEPMRGLLAVAEQLTEAGVLDITLFPPQPWLDVEEMGFGVLVTTDGDPGRGDTIAETIAEAVWDRRHQFLLDLVTPREAIVQARASTTRPFLLSESADAPTAGAAGDSPAMVRALLDHGPDLTAYVTLVDAPAVARCAIAAAGDELDLDVGASIDHRFHDPVSVRATLLRCGEGSVTLTGPAFTGLELWIGRWALVRAGRLHVLLTEHPAPTIDPVVWETVGLDVADADVVVVRSPSLFRAGYPQVEHDAVVLDLPGASTPRLDALTWDRIPRPMFPLDDVTGALLR